MRRRRKGGHRCLLVIPQERRGCIQLTGYYPEVPGFSFLLSTRNYFIPLGRDFGQSKWPQTGADFLLGV